MTSVEIEHLARTILADRDARRPGDWAGSVAGLSIAQAYAVQQQVAVVRERRGESVIGYKIGCTSPTIQQQLGIGQPIFGRLFDTGVFPSGERLSAGRFLNPAIEGELAVRLACDIAEEPGSDEEGEAAIGAVFAVIELHDHALLCDPPCAAELIVRNGMHAGFVKGEEHSCRLAPIPTPRRICVRIDDVEEASTTEPWAMRRPGAAIRWLARRLAEIGLSLRSGQVVLTGSVLPLIPVGPGRVVTVEAPPLVACAAGFG